MAISMTNKTSAGDAIDRGTGDPYTTGSLTLEPNRLYLLSVAGHKVNAPSTPTVTSSGATWTLVDSVDFNNIASPDTRLCLFTGTVSSQQIGSVSIEYAATQSGCRWSVEEVTGHNQISPVVQDSENRADTGTSFVAAGTPALSSWVSSDNAMFAVAISSSTDAINKEGGHTTLSDGTTQTGLASLHTITVWQIGEDTSPTFTTASNRFWAGITAEIAIAAGGGLRAGPTRGIERGVLRGTIR